jgi:hypothetical protein
MDKIECKSKTGKKSNHWKYIFIEVGAHNRIIVCKTFICEVLRINLGKLDEIQKKIIHKKSFNDMRGKHNNRVNKLNNSFSILFENFLNTFPKVKSHYTSSNKLYFENQELNINILFKEFNKFIVRENLNFKLDFSYQKFRIHFNENFNIGFKHPRTDLCDLHFKFEQIGLENLSDSDKLIFENHCKKVESYKLLKSKLLEKCDERICFEFDYSQNRPLPKLPNCEVFYKRLLWFYIFNVHLHNLNISYMFHFTEGKYPKSPNSVCSFLFFVINDMKNKKVFCDKVKEFIFFSDATASQNRCWTVARFCSFISIIFNINVTQIFPTRGHSFCICDSNFSLLARKLRKIEKIEVPENYIKLLNDQKKFEVISEKVFDFEKFLISFYTKNPKLKISKTVRISYFPNGDICMHESYNENSQIRVNILKCDIEIIKNLNFSDLSLIENIGINCNKEKDLKSLLKYLTPDNQTYYCKYLDEIKCKNITNCDISDSSEDEF